MTRTSAGDTVAALSTPSASATLIGCLGTLVQAVCVSIGFDASGRLRRARKTGIRVAETRSCSLALDTSGGFFSSPVVGARIPR
jgi:hypothetical protein